MIEGNEIIAEFMGAMPCEIMVKSIGIMKGYESEDFKLPIDELEYHKSWDWLIPVANKVCETIMSDKSIEKALRSDEGFIARMAGKTMFYKSITGKLEINPVYLKCVDFIKWYNDTKKLNK